MEYKNRVIRVENIPNLPINASIKLKPVASLWGMIAFSVFIMLTNRSWIIGIIIFILAIYGMAFVPNRKLIDFTNEFMISYLFNNKEECILIYWDEINQWRYIFGHGSNDHLSIVTNDGAKYMIDATNKVKVVKYLRKYAEAIELPARTDTGVNMK